MKVKFLILTVAVVGGLTSMGCATGEDKAMEKQVQAEPTPHGPDAIAARGAQTFLQAPGLTDEQRRKLLEIHTRVYAENSEVQAEIGKAKSLLFKSMISEKYDAALVSNLKKKIVNLDQRRLKIMFGALEDVEKVVGRGPDKEPIYRRFYDHDHQPGSHAR